MSGYWTQFLPREKGERERERGRERGREGGRERETEREGEREKGREGGRARGREGGRAGERERDREGEREMVCFLLLCAYAFYQIWFSNHTHTHRKRIKCKGVSPWRRREGLQSPVLLIG